MLMSVSSFVINSLSSLVSILAGFLGGSFLSDFFLVCFSSSDSYS